MINKDNKLWELCGPVCVFLITGRRAEERWDPARWRRVRVCMWDQCKLAQPKISHPQKMLFKGEVRISCCHSFRDFLIIHVFYCFCLLNKLFNFTGRRFLLESLLWVHGSNPASNNRCNSPGGIIPSEKTSECFSSSWGKVWDHHLSLSSGHSWNGDQQWTIQLIAVPVVAFFPPLVCIHKQTIRS